MRREYSFSKIRRPLPGSTGLNTAQAAVSDISCISFPDGPDTIQSLLKIKALDVSIPQR